MTTSVFDLKRAPTHPGAVLREDILPALEAETVSGFAAKLRISRQALHNILAEKSAISPSIAIRLAKILETSPEFWLNLQTKYDLWQALQSENAA